MKNIGMYLAAVVQLWSGLALAGGDSVGVRGGGSVVDVNGSPALLDLVTNSVCEWTSGSDLLAENPEVQAVLDRVARLDWYFAMDMKAAIAELDFCFTGRLRFLDPRDEDDSLIFGIEQTRQAAIRVNDEVFVDQRIFNAMSASMKAGLIIHEGMHTYLPMSVSQRKFKLRTLVRALHNVGGKIRTREQLHLQLNRSEAGFPLTVGQLDPYRDEIEFLLGDEPTKAAAFGRIRNYDGFATMQVEESLAPWHRGLDPVSTVRAHLGEVIVGMSADQLRAFLSQDRGSLIDPTQIAASQMHRLSAEQQAVLIELGLIGQGVQAATELLESAGVTQGRSRILANVALQRLGRGGSVVATGFPAGALVPVGASTLPIEIHAVAEIVVSLVKFERWDQLQALFADGRMARAMSLGYAIAQVRTIPVVVERDREITTVAIEDLARSLADGFSAYVKSRVSEEQYVRLKSILPVLN